MARLLVYKVGMLLADPKKRIERTCWDKVRHRLSANDILVPNFIGYATRVEFPEIDLPSEKAFWSARFADYSVVDAPRHQYHEFVGDAPSWDQLPECVMLVDNRHSRDVLRALSRGRIDHIELHTLRDCICEFGASRERETT